jgi:aminoglycoside phosphotransferase (APT) family kinase protein
MGAGHFAKDTLARVLAEVCAVAGLDHGDATLLRFTNNAVFRLARHPVVVRIMGSRALQHRVEKVVRVATWFADYDVPAVRLVPGVEQPVRAGDYLATVWDAVPDGGSPPRGSDLARLLRMVHALPAPAFPLPGWQPLADVRSRIDEAEGLGDADRVFLLSRCDQVDAQLGEIEFEMPPCLVHGDAHLGNLIPSPAGSVLCDFDSTCIGPPEWDLTPLAVGVVRFGEPASRYQELARTYGMDITRWSGFPVLREVRELKLITSVLPIMASNPGVRAELLRRLEDFRRGDTEARWARYT